MSKKEKLFEKLKNNPIGVSFNDIHSLLKEEGFLLDRVSGSHHVFRKENVVFVVPVHNKKVKTVYVQRAISIIEDLRKTKEGN